MIEQISRIVRLAGSEVMKIYTESGKFKIDSYKKSDQTPITNADLISHKIISYFLKRLTPNIPIISEEQIPEWNECRHWDYFWLIDPLDGTKEFLSRNGEFTINVAFIRHGEPIVGIIYLPAYNMLYVANDNQAWKTNNKGELLKISVKSSQNPVVVISRSHITIHDQKKLFHYLNNIKNPIVISVGSSFKFCLIAEGLAQFYPRFSATKIWDTAAGHAIVKAAGALVNDCHGVPLNYRNINEHFLNPCFQVSLYVS